MSNSLVELRTTYQSKAISRWDSGRCPADLTAGRRLLINHESRLCVQTRQVVDPFWD
jgi:hypothetical protein